MTKKPVQRVKHVPQRTCVGCRTVLAKRQMIRIVRTDEGVRVDPTSKLAGRGAYLHDRRECWERGLRGGLAHALKVNLNAEDRAQLEEFMKSLPQDAEANEEANVNE
ncbi:MAG: YlxR family protein [Anaerolineales bacterium]